MSFYAIVFAFITEADLNLPFILFFLNILASQFKPGGIFIEIRTDYGNFPSISYTFKNKKIEIDIDLTKRRGLLRGKFIPYWMIYRFMDFEMVKLTVGYCHFFIIKWFTPEKPHSFL